MYIIRDQKRGAETMEKSGVLCHTQTSGLGGIGQAAAGPTLGVGPCPPPNILEFTNYRSTQFGIWNLAAP